MDKIVGLLLWLIDLHDTSSANPVIGAQRGAARGMFYSLVSAAVLSALSVGVAPAEEARGGLATVAATFDEHVAVGLALAALAASAVGVYFFVRYVLVLKWPERFVNISE